MVAIIYGSFFSLTRNDPQKTQSKTRFLHAQLNSQLITGMNNKSYQSERKRLLSLLVCAVWLSMIKTWRLFRCYLRMDYLMSTQNDWNSALFVDLPSLKTLPFSRHSPIAPYTVTRLWTFYRGWRQTGKPDQLIRLLATVE